MFFLTEQERDALTRPCDYWLSRLSREEATVIGLEILEIFTRWQGRQADAKGNVKIGGGGLLGPGTERVVPIAETEPWQCAGPFVFDDIDLAFKLWLDNDPDFAHVIYAHGVGIVFSLVGLWSKRTAGRSLIGLNRLLVTILLDQLASADGIIRNLVDEVKTDKRKYKERLNRLAIGRQERAAEVRQQGIETARTYWKAAFDYFLGNPAADRDACVAFLQNCKLPPRSPGTIKKLIAGAFEKARATPRPSAPDYSTDHTRNR